MARPISRKVAAVREGLRQRILQGDLRAGERVPSGRALARRHGLSYQTAHRILVELAAEGLVEVRHGSGTVVRGAPDRPRGVVLCFHPRARRTGSFGAHLKRLLEAGLTREGLPFRTRWSGATPGPEWIPVFWEPAPGPGGFDPPPDRPALLLNDQRVTGLRAGWVDTIATDDFSGGACAAELLAQRLPGLRPRDCLVVAARPDDPRSRDRVAGFRSVLPVSGRQVLPAGSWFRADGERLAPAIAAAQPRAVFCCNDRLAEGVIRAFPKSGVPLPALVGFDDAPIAEKLGLTTIGMPWTDLVDAALQVLRRRLAGDRGGARRQILAPRPVVRWHAMSGAGEPNRHG